MLPKSQVKQAGKKTEHWHANAASAQCVANVKSNADIAPATDVGECCGLTGDLRGEIAAHAAASTLTKEQLHEVVLVCPHCGSEHIDNGAYSTINHLWHKC